MPRFAKIKCNQVNYLDIVNGDRNCRLCRIDTSAISSANLEGGIGFNGKNLIVKRHEMQQFYKLETRKTMHTDFQANRVTKFSQEVLSDF